MNAAGAHAGLVFLPLGGSGEIGRNLNLYGCDGKWLIVDFGVSFGEERMPGVDVTIADPSFIVERREDIVGLVLTHAHEDHLGAIPYLWPKLGCPVYATPFTAEVLRRKMADDGQSVKLPLHEVALGGQLSLGPFDIEFVSVTHSIPEPNSLVLRTPYGTVLHTGDWKIDPAPVIAPGFDEAALRRIGDDGVRAMICDSTNVFETGDSGSEGALHDSLLDLIGRQKNRVAVACFATNVARVATIARVGAACDRHVALAGRSLRRITEAARTAGYLGDIPGFLSEEDAAALPRDKVLILCTGSQGEPRAALARIAADDHRDIYLEAGDTVIFSSRVIPGNERAIGGLQNQLVRLGVEIITWRDHLVHVSGHPGQDEMRRMYEWIKPEIAVPVHGEPRHLDAHAALARSWGVEHVPVAENGAMLRLAPGEPEIIEQVTTGKLGVLGRRIVAENGTTMRDRRRALFNGAVTMSLVIDADGSPASKPRLSARGFLDPEKDSDIIDEALNAVDEALARLPAKMRSDDDAVSEAARRALRRALSRSCGKRPIAEIHLHRL